MAKVLVTGGAGFIGSHLTDKLIERGHKVVVIDNLSTGKKENLNPRTKFYKIDICSPKISQIFKKEKPKIVFHLAAIPRVPLSVKDPLGTSRVNILGTLNVFKAGVETKVKRIIFASSSSVYGDQKKLPLKENTLPSPISPYGLQKLTCEKFAKLFTQLYKIPIISLRFFNVFGPKIDFDSDYSLVIGKFLKQKSEGRPLTIFGSGLQTRDFCYIDDVVSVNIKAMKSPEGKQVSYGAGKKLKGGEVINISSGKSYSINYLAKLIGGKIKYLPLRPGDVLHIKADITLAKKLLNWQPKISFEEGIKKTQEWFETLMGFRN